MKWIPSLIVAGFLLRTAADGLYAETTQETPILELPSALELAVSRNLRLAQSALAISQARLGIDDARAALTVQITPELSGSLGDDNNRWQAGLDASRKFSSGAQATIGGRVRETQQNDGESLWRSSLRIDVQQPLFSQFGPLIHLEPVRQADDQLMREQRKWELQKADLILDVVKTFEELISLEQQIKSDEAFHRRTEALCRLTRAREAQGRSTRVDTLRVELQRGQAEGRLENNRERLFTRRRDLAELLGMPQDTPFELVPPPLPDFDIPSPEAALQTAFSNRLDYAQLLQDYRTRRRAVRIAQRRMLPNVALVASAELYDEQPDFSDSTRLTEDTWTIGLAGDSDLLKRHERIARRQAELDEESMRQLIDIKAITITREVLQALSLCRRTRSEAAIQERNYQLATDRVTLARRLYEAGRTDNFSVTDAEDAFLKAEIQLLEARAAYVLSGYQLLKQTGTLLEPPDHLKPNGYVP